MSFAERFEDLRIWQEAREQVFAIYPRNACECWKVDSANGSASGSASSSPSNVPTFKLSHSTPEDFWALKNVSFEVEKAKWSASSAAIALASGSSNV